MKTTLLLCLATLCGASMAFAAEPSKPETAKESAKSGDMPAESAKEIVLFDGKSLDDWEMVDIGASGAVEAPGRAHGHQCWRQRERRCL